MLRDDWDVDGFRIKSESPGITFLEPCKKVDFYVTKSANISAIHLEESLNVLLPMPSVENLHHQR